MSLNSSAAAERSIEDRFAICGITLLRLALGVMFLAHALILKWLTYTLPGTAQYFVSVGLPAWLGYVTFSCEAIGGSLLVLGIQTRWVALGLSPFLIGAIVAVHWQNGWVFTSPNGGWEYPAYLVVLCLAQSLLGDGHFALKPSTLPRFLNRNSFTANRA